MEGAKSRGRPKGSNTVLYRVGDMAIPKNAEEMAEHLGCSVKTVRNKAKAGTIQEYHSSEAFYLPGGKVNFRKSKSAREMTEDDNEQVSKHLTDLDVNRCFSGALQMAAQWLRELPVEQALKKIDGAISMINSADEKRLNAIAKALIKGK